MGDRIRALESHMESTEATLLARITQDPGVCGGRPCVRGLRIRVSDVLELLAEGLTSSQIIEDFPDLQPDDIRACLLFAARRTAHAQVAA